MPFRAAADNPGRHAKKQTTDSEFGGEKRSRKFHRINKEAGATYAPMPSLSQVGSGASGRGRLEYRRDRSNHDFFNGENGAVPSRSTLEIGVLAFFGEE